MKKIEDFLRKHGLSPMDWNRLLKYEEVRESGHCNMFEYITQMKKEGNSKLADWILDERNYEDFLDIYSVLSNQRKARENFLKKHGLEEKDWNNLVRFETTMRTKVLEKDEYLTMSITFNINGGTWLSDFVKDEVKYKEFLKVYGGSI